MTGCNTHAKQVPPRAGDATAWRLDCAPDWRTGWYPPQNCRQSARTSTIATGTVTSPSKVDSPTVVVTVSSATW